MKNETNETKTRWLGVAGDADALGPAVFGFGLGAAAFTNDWKRMFSQELEK